MVFLIVNGKLEKSTTPIYTPYCIAEKVGNIVTLTGRSQGEYSIKAGQYQAITTLPVGLRPSRYQFFHVTSLGGTATIFGRIDLDGIVYLYTSSNTNYWAYTVTYIV